MSSALYLAVIATCRDVVCAIGRLRGVEAQGELCRLLWNLSQISVLRCFNGQDLATLATATGKALAALPPDCIPDFWHSLSHTHPARRQAVAYALSYLQDPSAVPFLLTALDVPGGQSTALAQQIVACLGGLGDVRALPALAAIAVGGDRKLREPARAASAAIQRATHRLPSRTLLRAAQETDAWDYETMLRSVSVNNSEEESVRELLRVAEPACTSTAGPPSSDSCVSQPVRECHHE